MSEEEKKKPEGLSRREFLKDAGLVVGGATVGSMAILSACSGDTSTVTNTVTNTVTSTTTVGGAGSTVTTTVTATGAGVTKYIDPVDGSEWPTAEALRAHFLAAHPNAEIAESFIVMTVNGVGYGMQVQPNWSLAHVLRDKLGLFALKEGCQHGECGACAVVVDGHAVFSCLMLAIEMNGINVTTVEGLSNNGVLGPVQQKFYDQDVAQCGYCTPGFIMAAVGLYNSKPKPTLDEVREAVAGHVCMCGNVHRSVLCIAGGV
jgi:xanthine dehydrogenase YagT iron-sulfur-binding subunit